MPRTASTGGRREQPPAAAEALLQLVRLDRGHPPMLPGAPEPAGPATAAARLAAGARRSPRSRARATRSSFQLGPLRRPLVRPAAGDRRAHRGLDRPARVRAAAASTPTSSTRSRSGSSRCGLVGARLYHIVTDWARFSGHLERLIPQIWTGGLGIYGAVLGGAIGALHRRRGASASRSGRCSTASCPGVAAAQAHRPLRQLLQPGAVRRPDQPALGPRDLPGQPPRRLRADGHLPPDVPVRVALGLPDVRRAAAGGPRRCGGGSPGGAIFALYLCALLVRPLLGRGPADRPGPRARPAAAEPGRRRGRVRVSAGFAFWRLKRRGGPPPLPPSGANRHSSLSWSSTTSRPTPPRPSRCSAARCCSSSSASSASTTAGSKWRRARRAARRARRRARGRSSRRGGRSSRCRRRRRPMMRASSGICVAGQPVGIAGAVPALVVVADRRRRVAQAGDAAGHLLADLGVRAHERLLGVGQRPGLASIAVGDRDLADVVQPAAEPAAAPTPRAGPSRSAIRPARSPTCSACSSRHPLAQARRQRQRLRPARRLGLLGSASTRVDLGGQRASGCGRAAWRRTAPGRRRRPGRSRSMAGVEPAPPDRRGHVSVCRADRERPVARSRARIARRSRRSARRPARRRRARMNSSPPQRATGSSRRMRLRSRPRDLDQHLVAEPCP